MQNLPEVVVTPKEARILERLVAHYDLNPGTILHAEGLKTTLALSNDDIPLIHNACTELAKASFIKVCVRQTQNGHNHIFGPRLQKCTSQTG